MFGTEFYNESIKRYVTFFGTLFNNVVITRKDDDDGEVFRRVKVPISYSPREKLLARVKQDPNLDRPVAIVLPRMGFEMTGMNYAAERRLASTQLFTSRSSNSDKNASVFVPVPYDINFQLSILVANAEDGTQILEQILPFFGPEWTNSIRLIDESDIILDVPLILNSASVDDIYEGDFDTRRALTWTLDFTMKCNLFGPTKQKKVITIAKTNIFPTMDLSANTGGEGITITPGLVLSANLAGTVTSSNTTVTGVGNTQFTSDFFVGSYLKVPGQQFRKVNSIANNTSLTIETAFSPNLVANTYQSTLKGTPTSNSALTIDRAYINEYDNWGYIVAIEDV